jgi:hypothetical protein
MTRRYYTIAEVLDKLRMHRRTFERQRKCGGMPFLEELQPRVGRPRYRAELIDRYLDNAYVRGAHRQR